MSIYDAIIGVAQSYVGQHEVPGNLGFQDKTFEKKMTEVGWRKTQAWCCYFSELVYKEAFAAAGYDGMVQPNMFDTLDKLFSASTQKTYNNFKANGTPYNFTVSDTPQPGDLVIWKDRDNSAQGHVGIVTSGLSEDGKTFSTIEGNTNEKGGREGLVVAAKDRNYTFSKTPSLVLRGFVHYNI